MKKESKLTSIIRKMIKEEMNSNSNISTFSADWNESVEEIFENLKEFLSGLGYHVYENPLVADSSMSSILISKDQLGENEIQAWVDLQDDN